MSKSHHNLDEQFAVLTRLVVMQVNEFASKHNQLLGVLAMAMDKEIADDLRINEVSYDDINLMFMEWQRFKARPDWREHSTTWYTGGDVNSLPPPPEQPPEPEAKEEDEDEPGERHFGGDYDAESDNGDQSDPEGGPEGESQDEADEVSEVQTPHPPEAEHPGEGSDPEVPELRD